MKVKPNNVSMVFRCPQCRHEAHVPIGSYPERICEQCLEAGRAVELKKVTMELESIEVSTRGLPTEKVYDVLEHWINNFGCPNEEMVKQVTSAHRTLQQSFMRLFLGCIVAWSKQEHFDDRNRRTIELSKKIIKELADDLYLPCI